MNKTILGIIIIFIFTTNMLYSQDDVVNVIGDLIKNGKLSEASQKIDEYLKLYPKNENVLMMKGNVLFNQFMSDRGQVEVSANMNESIYDSNIGFMREPIIIFSKEEANDITSYYLKALNINFERIDIHMGICYVYSIAVMENELINRIKILRETFPDEKGLQFNMGDYARMFNERGKFEECINIYKEIIKLYPESSELLSDLAAMYFTEGDLENASVHINESLENKKSDEMTLKNAALINTINMKYDIAYDNLKAISELNNSSDHLLYYGLLLLYKGNVNWKDYIKKYLKNSSKEKNENEFGKTILKIEFKYDDFQEAYFKIKNSIFQFLANEIAMKLFPGEFQPILSFADLHTYYQNFNVANVYYQKIEDLKENMDEEKKGVYDFYYAWSLYKVNNFEKANTRWERLLKNDNFYIRSAAAYFLGKFYENINDNRTALKYYKIVSGKANESKYATYCWNRVNYLTDHK